MTGSPSSTGSPRSSSRVVDLEILANVLIFIPIGVLGAMVLPRQLWWVAVLAGGGAVGGRGAVPVGGAQFPGRQRAGCRAEHRGYADRRVRHLAGAHAGRVSTSLSHRRPLIGRGRDHAWYSRPRHEAVEADPAPRPRPCPVGVAHPLQIGAIMPVPTSTCAPTASPTDTSIGGFSPTSTPRGTCGERLGLIGENGAGKSTLLRILAQAPSRRMPGWSYRPPETGLLVQEVQHDPDDTVGDLLDAARRTRGAPSSASSRMPSALSRATNTPLLRRPRGGGTRRRVGHRRPASRRRPRRARGRRHPPCPAPS